MNLNKPETGYILLGCIGAIVSGAVQPASGVTISKAIAVIFNFNNFQIRIKCMII